MSFVKHFPELDVYQNAMSAVMNVFELPKRWPSEERFNLIDQIRRSSRSVCTDLAEAWRKRRARPSEKDNRIAAAPIRRHSNTPIQ